MVSSTVNQNGSFSYTPHPNYTGFDNFHYQISDGYWTDAANVTLNIIPISVCLPLVVK